MPRGDKINQLVLDILKRSFSQLLLALNQLVFFLLQLYGATGQLPFHIPDQELQGRLLGVQVDPLPQVALPHLGVPVVLLFGIGLPSRCKGLYRQGKFFPKLPGLIHRYLTPKGQLGNNGE